MTANTRFRCVPGTVACTDEHLSAAIQNELCVYYQKSGYDVHGPLDPNPRPKSRVLSATGQFYNYALLNGRRITPLSRSKRRKAGSSIVRVRWNGEVYGGEVASIFHHFQRGTEAPLFAEIHWMIPLESMPIECDPWLN